MCKHPLHNAGAIAAVSSLHNLSNRFLSFICAAHLACIKPDVACLSSVWGCAGRIQGQGAIEAEPASPHLQRAHTCRQLAPDNQCRLACQLMRPRLTWGVCYQQLSAVSHTEQRRCLLGPSLHCLAVVHPQHVS